MKTNWQMKKLGDICDFEGGSQPSKTNFIFTPKKGYVRFLQIRDFKSNKNVTYIPESKKNRLCNKEDILIGRYGASVGQILTGEEGAYNVALMKTLPNLDVVDRQFFYYYLISAEFQSRLSKVSARSAQAGFSKEDIYNFPVLTPPLSEQKRIVKTLDEVLEKLEKAKENTEKNLQNSKELFESYLNDIFSNPGKGWEESSLRNITSKIGSGATPNGGEKSYKENGISLIRSLNVHDNGFRYKALAHIDDSQATKLNNVTVEKGDVLLNITGASVARCCIVPDGILPARVNQHVSIIRTDKSKLESAFLHYLLISKFYKDVLLSIGEEKGVTRQALTKNIIEKFAVKFPKSIQEQKQIVKKLDQLSEKTKELESLYKQKLENVEELKKSILQKAFSGGL